MSKNKVERISAGSYDLNKWLHGGYERGVITMIAGPPASGKTNFTTLAACGVAKKGSRVIFIDTEGGFSPERVKQITGENHKEILKNILILNPVNFEEQKEIFEKLLARVKKEHAGLIIVDGMAMLYRLELGEALQDVKEKDDEKVKSVNREVAKQMRILAEIARKQNIPIIITNQVYSEFLSEEDRRKGFKPGVNLVGGQLFKYWSKAIIELEYEREKRKAILSKHRSIPRRELGFVIKDKGIFKRGWI